MAKTGEYATLLKEKIETLKELCRDIDNEVEKQINNILQRLENPFLITVFGEVNSGKSSFINALLKIPDLCRTDVDICTDKIYVIKYCPEEGQKTIDSLTEELCVKNPLLKGFVIIDTPGINSVLEHHTYITERFLPKSDVILVVLSADNPHTKALWDWIKQISHNFGKRIVFILQKSDRLNKEQLKKIMERVKSYAKDSGIDNPQVFPVSALKELSGQEDSGFEQLRSYLNQNFTGEKQILLKLEGSKKELVKFYTLCLEKVNRYLNEAISLKRNFEETLYLVVRKKREAEIYKNLVLELVDKLIHQLSKYINSRLEEISVIDITFRRKKVSQTLKDIEEYLTENIERFVKRELVPSLELFEESFLKTAVEEVSKRREELKKFLQKVGKEYIETERMEKISEKLEGSFTEMKLPSANSAILLMGSSLTAGTILAVFGSSFIVDITGGIISALGVLLGSAFVLKKKRDLEKQIENLLREKIGLKLKEEIQKVIKNRISETLGVMEIYLDKKIAILEQQIKELEEKKFKLQDNLNQLKKMNIIP